jgi:hypothetical protein
MILMKLSVWTGLICDFLAAVSHSSFSLIFCLTAVNSEVMFDNLGWFGAANLHENQLKVITSQER